MHKKIRLAILQDSSDIIEIDFLHTKTRGAIHRSDIPLLIEGLQTLDQLESEASCLKAAITHGKDVNKEKE